MNVKIIYSDLKESARNDLKGNWGIAISTLFTGLLFKLAPDAIEFISSYLFINSNSEVFKIILLVTTFGLISSFITTIIDYGCCKFSLNMVSNEKNFSFNNIFNGFSIIPRLIPIWFTKGILLEILLLPDSLSSALNADYSTFKIFSAIESSYSIGLITSIIYLVLNAYLSQTHYLLIENDSKTPIQCLKESIQMMRGYVGEYIVLNLSFIGWFILALCTCGIGFLWLIPYINITLAKFHEKIRDGYYGNINEIEI